MTQAQPERLTLSNRAAECVSALDEGRNLEEVLDGEPGWNEAFVDAIRTFKERFRGSKDLQRLLRITGELLYGKEVHWAMELVQNAEDAGATRMAFVFEQGRVLVWNNGAAFSSRDTWAICSAGHSAKKNKIGFFGIGFKSVYKLTAAPEIYSGPFALRIEDKLYPVPLPRRHMRAGAWFVLPVLAPQRPKLSSMLATIAAPDFAQVLLTLTSLSEIKVIDRTGNGMSGRFIRRKLLGDQAHVWDECEIGGTWPGVHPRRWRRFFHNTDAVPEGVSREGRTFEAGDRSLVIVARPIGDPSAELRLHCFLPTSVRSELRWLVQADFEPNASREQLRDSPWNRWLMNEVGRALAHAVYESARTIGDAPWDLVPLDAEVRDPLQREAFAVADRELRESRFVATRKGWRSPAAATWGFYPGMIDVVREGDLPAATGSDVSYVRDGVLGPVAGDSSSRAEEVLEAFGASPVGCPELIKLLASDDATFRRVRREPQWWVTALHLIARYGDLEQKAALAQTACLPIRGGTRVAPSPEIASEGYLVAFSRADIGEDLRAFLGPSEVLLVEPYLSPRSDGRRRETRSSSDIATVREVADMLEAPPFNVAADAGVYHVVASLVMPRMNSLEASGPLTPDQVTLAWRLFEYVRQKWPTYVSEYRRRRNDKATDATIAAELGARIRIVATVGSGRGQSRQMRPVTDAYLPTAFLEFEAMDVALSGDERAAFVDQVHLGPLTVSVRRRGGRVRGAVPSPVEFLRILGAPIGPRVVKRPTVQVGPKDIPWVDWTGIPPGARGRVGMADDWQAPDLARLLVRWPSLAQRGRQRRGQALLRAIEADWVRLAPTARARPMYFYSGWNHWDAPAASTWVGELQQVQWLPSASGTLERPSDLVLETSVNRLALGGSTDGLLRWRAATPEAVAAMGVLTRPSPDRVIDTLVALRAGDAAVQESDALAVAGACYQTLAEHLREGAPPESTARLHIVARMRGGSGRGLIYAPPPDGVAGERWWPPSRVLQNDAARWVGPYLGQLARRYRGGATLWEALGIRRDLTAEIARDLIENALSEDEDRARALEYYGRLVAFLESLPGQPLSPSGFPPALTTNGWMPAATALWTARAEMFDAFALTLGWWEPGNRDPSASRKAAAFLGIREVGIDGAADSPITERWEIRDRSPLELGLEAQWHLALRTWPHVLREDVDPSQSAVLDDLSEEVADLTPITAGHLRGHLAYSAGGAELRASVAPAVVVRHRDRLVVGRTSEDLFSAAAAATIGQLVHNGQRASARSLAFLLSLAAHEPAELEKIAARFSVIGYQHREFTYVPPEGDDLDAGAVDRVLLKPRRGRASADSHAEAAPIPLADHARYGLVATANEIPPEPAPTTTLVPGGLKPALEPDDEDGDKGQDSGYSPPAPRSRFSNTDIEGAASPFIAEYELETRGVTITRQSSGVGADFVASDGRYIEVKAFSGEAGSSFDLEPTEWRAAKRPGIGERYWVYVVEHLKDGQPPKITAIFNPVTDEFTQKVPTGKLRIRGWRSAATRHSGEFGERTIAADADDKPPPTPEEDVLE